VVTVETENNCSATHIKNYRFGHKMSEHRGCEDFFYYKQSEIRFLFSLLDE